MNEEEQKGLIEKHQSFHGFFHGWFFDEDTQAWHRVKVRCIAVCGDFDKKGIELVF
jgi:hypothetical protein